MPKPRPGARQMWRPKTSTAAWRCRSCGCSNHKPCADGCCWVAEKLCSSCKVTPETLAAMITADPFLLQEPLLDLLRAFDPLHLSRTATQLRAERVAAAKIQALAGMRRRGPRGSAALPPRSQAVQALLIQVSKLLELQFSPFRGAHVQ